MITKLRIRLKTEFGIHNKMTNCHKSWNKMGTKLGHKLEQQLDLEQADGVSQNFEQKLAIRSGA